MKKKHIILIFSFLLLRFSEAQNLVPNPSFESYISCPAGLSSLNLAWPWYNANAGNTPDFFHTCAFGTFAGVPANRFGDQIARTGNGYGGVFSYYPPSGSNNSREYIGVELCDTLKGGVQYYVEVFISLGDSSQYASDDFGIYLSNTQIIGAGNLVLPYVPQINNTPGLALGNKTGWMQVSGNYVALGGEKYITVGSFKNFASANITTAVNPGSTQFFYNNAYYYIDDVFVGIQKPAVSNDTIVCAGSAVTLSAVGGYSYHWTGGRTTSSIVVNPTSTTKYYVDIVGACDTIRDSVQVVVSATLTAAIVGNPVVCEGQATTLTATGGFLYSWNNSSTDVSINVSPTSNTVYSVTVSNGICYSSALITVSVLPTPQASAGPDDTICSGESALLSASGSSFYSWSNGSTTHTTIVTPPLSTIYSVTVSNGGCEDIDSVNITVRPPPLVTISADTTIYMGSTVTLSASGGGSYIWSPSAGLSCITCQSPIASPTQTTSYYVVVTNEYGCTFIDTLTITVNLDCGEVFVPTAFSPNNDGQNDALLLYGKCIKSLNFIVFNRWGEIVFEANDLSDTWDGSYRGKPLDAAVFSYLVKAVTFNNDDIVLSGNITLVR